MHVGALRATFSVPGARSLKDKRAPLRSLKDRLARRFNVSVAEVAAQDRCRTVVLGIALVDGEARNLRGRMQALRRMLEADPALRLTDLEERVVDRQEGAAPDADADGDEDGLDDLLFADLDVDT